MKILIHALGAKMGGAMRHLTSFLPELGKQDDSREYVVLVRESFPEMELPKNIRLEHLSDRDCTSWVKRIFYDVFTLPRKLKRENFSAIVSLTNFGPIWSPVPHIFFQRNALYYCPLYLGKVSGRAKLEVMLRRALAVASMMCAKLIITPSNTMAVMIRDNCPKVKSRRFRTLYHGFDFSNCNSKASKLLPLSEFSSWPVLFFPSHLAEYKGYRLLFDVINILRVRFPNIKLVLTFNRHDDPVLYDDYQSYVQKLGIANNVSTIGQIHQNEIWDIYKNSDLMVYPSLCESFGFSMLEAMGLNLPIIAADTDINREICGGAARYFSPTSATDCANEITVVLDKDAARDFLLNEGAKRISEFDWSWRRYVCEFIKILEDLKL